MHIPVKCDSVSGRGVAVNIIKIQSKGFSLLTKNMRTVPQMLLEINRMNVSSCKFVLFLGLRVLHNFSFSSVLHSSLVCGQL